MGHVGRARRRSSSARLAGWRERRADERRRGAGARTWRTTRPRLRGGLSRRARLRAVDAQFPTIIGTVLAVGFGLAGLTIRTMARIDQRIDNDKAAADADRRAFQTAAAADRRAFQAAMDAFRTEMQRLAEWQSHVEGMVAERRAAAD